MIFSLIWHHHDWLIGGALGAALTYSGAAAVHACLLVWRGPFKGELDFTGLLAILSTSCVLIVPLLNWSSTLRALGAKDNELSANRTIILYWAFLVTVGFLCIFYIITNPDTDPTVQNFLVPSTYENISCSPTGGMLAAHSGQNPHWNYFALDTEFVAENLCVDPCQSLDASFAIFRDQGDLKTLGKFDYDLWVFNTESPRAAEVQRAARFYITYGLLLLPYVLLQAIWVVVFFGGRNLRQCRNILYLRLGKLKPGFMKSPNGISKYLAIMAYLWAVFVSIICIPMFVFNIVASELLISLLPQSESEVHIGAWAPWSAVALVLVAAVLWHYNTEAVHGWVHVVNGIFYSINWVMRLCRGEMKRSFSYLSPQTIQKRLRKIYNLLASPLHRWYTGVVERVTIEYDDLLKFWRDPSAIKLEDTGPQYSRHHQDDPIHVRWELIPGGRRLKQVFDDFGVTAEYASLDKDTSNFTRLDDGQDHETAQDDQTSATIYGSYQQVPTELPTLLSARPISPPGASVVRATTMPNPAYNRHSDTQPLIRRHAYEQEKTPAQSPDLDNDAFSPLDGTFYDPPSPSSQPAATLQQQPRPLTGAIYPEQTGRFSEDDDQKLDSLREKRSP